jgi:hypothetical protein
MAHAKLSPSGAHRWMRCPGSVALEAAFSDQSSSYAAEGTLAHTLASDCLEHPAGKHPSQRIGEQHDVDGYSFTVDQTMADYVDDYIRLVLGYAQRGLLLVEQRVPIGHLTGEQGATGTSDAIVVDTANRVLFVVDLKYGMGVKIDAGDNPQLMLYALGALEQCDQLGEFDQVCMVIHQPRLNHVSEHWLEVAELLEFAEDVRLAAIEVGDHEVPRLEPGEKQCRFCKAKSTCPALAAEVGEIVSGSATLSEFDTPDMTTGDNYLSMAMSKVELVEQWCTAVRAEVERRLLAGQTVDGFKLVEGRKGNRKWSSDTEVETLFKSFRLRQDEMYDYSLISPTKAEKLLKDTPKRWERAQALISRADGKPSVAPATDKRPTLAVQSVADDFRDLTAN